MYILILIIGIFLLSVFGLWYLIKDAVRVYDKLNHIHDVAKHTNNKNELETLFPQLKEVSKECWHKEIQNKCNLIYVFIDTKYKCLQLTINN